MTDVSGPISAKADPDAPAIALAGRELTYGGLAAAARACRKGLDRLAPGSIVLGCHDVDRFATGLLAIWRGDRIAELPSSLQRSALAELEEEPTVAGTLRDDDVADPVALPPRQLDAALGPVPLERTLVRLHTSGSTGLPQRVSKTAGQLLGEAEVLARLLEAQSSDRILATVAPHHIYGLLFGVLVPWAAGACLVGERALHAEAVEAAIHRHRATILITTPSHLRSLVRLDRSAVAGLRRVVSSGAPLSSSLAAQVQRRWKLRVTEVFGSTETGGIATREVPTPDGKDAIWRPLPGVGVGVDDDGVLQLSSPFAPPGSGKIAGSDRVRLVDGGFVHLGRSDDVVKIAGKRVSVREIQHRLDAIPGVADAVVWPEHDDIARGTRLCALVVADGVDRETIRRHLGQWYDAAVLPRVIRFVDHIPRGPSGKASREGLVAAMRGGDAETGSAHLALGPMQGGGLERSRRVTISAECALFDGHFPGAPVLPGVAELTEIVLPSIAAAWPGLGSASRVSRLKFRRPIRPGDTLTVQLQRPGEGDRVTFVLRREETICASGTLWFPTGGS